MLPSVHCNHVSKCPLRCAVRLGSVMLDCLLVNNQTSPRNSVLISQHGYSAHLATWQLGSQGLLTSAVPWSCQGDHCCGVNDGQMPIFSMCTAPQLLHIMDDLQTNNMIISKSNVQIKLFSFTFRGQY